MFKTFEQFNEAFGFSNEKKYFLNKLLVSPKTNNLFNSYKNITENIIKFFMKPDFNLTLEQAQKATLALFDYANGSIPSLKNLNIIYNKDDDTLTIKPNEPA